MSRADDLEYDLEAIRSDVSELQAKVKTLERKNRDLEDELARVKRLAEDAESAARRSSRS